MQHNALYVKRLVGYSGLDLGLWYLDNAVAMKSRNIYTVNY